MNLTRALEVALPEIPARKLAETYPRMDPGTSAKEHIEDGKPVVRVYVPSSKGIYMLTPDQWALAQVFNGQRSYEEIAELYSQEHDVLYDAEEIREFAAGLDSNEFWYKTPQEKNIQLLRMTREERKKKQQQKEQSKWADLSEVNFPAFNPDRFVTWFYGKTKFIYTPWFTAVTVLGFLISGVITATHWGQIWADTVDFYNFSEKTWGDVFALYTLGLAIVGVHEFAHAHACKHYGGRVPAMGISLVYLTPAFYTDTTEGFVKGTRYQRFVIVLAGIWSELILCAIATPIWVDTAPRTLAHDGAHFVMMMCGLMTVLLNWNPLMKLDGYFMLSEIVGIADLKEASTAYASAWVKRRVWRLPVEVPYVPRRRRLGFVIYALLSGAYSYTILFILARFAGNFVRNFSPEWGFIPEIGVALVIFRSRIRLLVKFMKFVYLDKKDRILLWVKSHAALAVAGVVLLVAIPIRRESVTGEFILEPQRQATIRARVPGTITEVGVREGQAVSAGQVLARLESVRLESEYDEARSRLTTAGDRATSASLRYIEYGSALQERERIKKEVKELDNKRMALEILSPISGTVISPKVQDKLGTTIGSGDEIAEIADLSSLRARIYVSEWDISRVRAGEQVKLQVDGFFRTWEAETNQVSSEPMEMQKGLTGDDSSSGGTLPHYYVVDLTVANAENLLRPGMTGLARIYGPRSSLGARGWEAVRNFWGRKLW